MSKEGLVVGLVVVRLPTQGVSSSVLCDLSKAGLQSSVEDDVQLSRGRHEQLPF